MLCCDRLCIYTYVHMCMYVASGVSQTGNHPPESANYCAALFVSTIAAATAICCCPRLNSSSMRLCLCTQFAITQISLTVLHLYSEPKSGVTFFGFQSRDRLFFGCQAWQQSGFKVANSELGLCMDLNSDCRAASLQARQAWSMRASFHCRGIAAHHVFPAEAPSLSQTP